MTLEQYIKEKITDKEALPFETQKLSLKKNEHILCIGDTETGVYFVDSGIVEIGLIANNENKIQEFYFPHQFPSAYMSYLEKTPSDVYIACVTNCVVEKIPYDQLLSAQKTSRVARQLGVHMMQQNFLLRVKKEKDLLTKSAEERYTELFEKRPEIIQQIPDVKIAKYMGIHPQSLSRLKRLFFESKR